MPHDGIPLAAVLLAHGGPDASVLEDAMEAAQAAGAERVVVVLARGADGPPESRIARVAAGASAISALRAGMALLTNSPARLALLWPLDAPGASATADVASLLRAAQADGASVTAFAGADLDTTPVVVSRDAWLDVVTVGEQGLGAVAARRGLRSVALTP